MKMKQKHENNEKSPCEELRGSGSHKKVGTLKMSRLGSSSQFTFNSAQGGDSTTLNGENCGSSDHFDIHPMELVVQSVVGEPLEALSNQLQTLHESQVVLIARLKIIEEKLKKFESQLIVDVDIKTTEERLHTIKARLTESLITLKKVEKRVKNRATQKH